jgi:MoxR-like ATPase
MHMRFFFNRKAHSVFNAIGEVREALGTQQYIASDEIATVMFLAERLGKPVLAEGPAGVGKTELSKAWAAASGRDQGAVRVGVR